jgi:glycosyltransferase involved in cell wall biosynthesis
VHSGIHPEISVIIPTHNRAAYITQTLDALAQQTNPPGRIEIILVADGCTDDTAAVACRYAGIAPFTLRLVEQPGSGPAQARNAGAGQARGKILLFLDDDIEATPQLIAAHLEMHAAGPKQVAIGYLPTRLYGQKGYFRALLRSSWEDFFNRMREPGHRFTYQDLLTGNVSLERSLFASLGGFDVSFRCHEDWEFGYRLLKAGAQFAFAGDAAGYHHERTAMERSFRRKTAEGIADVQLGKLHPELRGTLHLAKLAAACHPSDASAASRRRARFHRTIRDTALYRIGIGDRVAEGARRLLDVLERLRLQGRWSLLQQSILTYWYWRGIAKSLPTLAAVDSFLGSVAPEIDEAFPVVDLEVGREQVERWVDRERPRALRILYGESVIGLIYPQAGAERLRGVHLRATLAKEMWWTLHHVLIAEKVPGYELLTQEQRVETVVPEAESDGVAAPARPALPAKEVRWPVPMLVADLDLSRPVQPLQVGHPYPGGRVLVRENGRPLGWIWLDSRPEPFTEDELRGEVEWQLAGVAPCGPLPAMPEDHLSPISVVVCTRDRAESLKRTLDSLTHLDYSEYEVIVVDNASATDETFKVVSAAASHIRYVREERPGLDWARNRGIAEARHEIVAFTDDDACPDRDWLRAVASVFASPDVMAATGLVAPAELETWAQILFELVYGGMGHGFRPKVFRVKSMPPRNLLWASGAGVGANMAFRRSVFDAVGLFDTALDVGTPASGGGDIEMFHRILARGKTLAYEPGMLVWHYHRPGMEDLRRLARNNGCSFGAYLLTCLRNRTVGPATVFHFAINSWFGDWLLPRLVRPAGLTRGLVLAELEGALHSPVAYLQSRARARRVAEAFRFTQDGNDTHRIARPATGVSGAKS